MNSCTEIETGGCIDPAAYNYESFADYDDGSCLYVVGCTDPAADNYNPEAGLEVVNGCGCFLVVFFGLLHLNL